MKQKWYLNTWLICILFAFWFIYGIPLVVGIILLMLKAKDEKKLKIQIELLNSDVQKYEQMMTPEMQNAIDLKRHVENLQKNEVLITQRIDDLNVKSSALEYQIKEKQKQIITFDDEILVQEFGLYTPQYDFTSALDYKEELAKIRSLQKDLIKNKNNAV